MGMLGKADLPAGGTPTLVWTNTLGKEITANIRFTNRNVGNVKIRAAIGTGASVPAASEWIDYDIEVKRILEDMGMSVSPGEKIWCYSDTANVSVRIHGPTT